MIELLEYDVADPQARLPALLGPTWVLVRSGSQVLGMVKLNGLRPATARRDLVWAVRHRLYARASLRPEREPSAVDPAAVSVVVCTRDRPRLLEGCLEALQRLDPPPGEVVVVDNAPTSAATREVAERWGVRRVLESRPGLDRARNTGWRKASGQVVLFIDDDARADPRLVAAMGAAFVGPEVAAVTGLVLPAELHSYPQTSFEQFEGGMGKGYERRLYHRESAPVGLEAFRVGVGTNMAFRRRILEEVGGFDPSLDVGTATRGGGDLDMFYRVLEAGRVVVYEPCAVVRHIHRRHRAALVGQMRDYGTSFAAYLAKRAEESPAQAKAVRAYRWRWHLDRHLRRALSALRSRQLLHFQMVWAEARGSLRGAAALERARRETAATP
ncbi:MAG: glycosyltransferase [Actinomycetota bacterium]|nr:glycosyltransferase [Actinomycetota bacterium]